MITARSFFSCSLLASFRYMNTVMKGGLTVGGHEGDHLILNGLDAPADLLLAAAPLPPGI